MSTIEVRAMRARDAAEVAALSARCFGASAWSAADLEAELARDFAEVWVARSHPAAPIEAYAIAWFADEGELLTVGVEPAARRRGLGRALVERVQASARERGVRWLTLEVRRGNAAAVALYEALGFATIDVRRRYYADGEDALVMAWRPAP
ncbi:MAG TPA: ribosomal protein S18-alanine N-acetyltransferase [Sandaracinaceae bacterium]